MEILFLLEGIGGGGSDRAQTAGRHARMWYSDWIKNEPVLNKWRSESEVQKLWLCADVSETGRCRYNGVHEDIKM